MKLRATLLPVVFVAVVLAGMITAGGGSRSAADSVGYLALWPSVSSSVSPSGDADAEATALDFTRDYLGFTEIDRVTASTTEGDEAWVGVGYQLPDGGPSTAATVHLARLGADARWVVVGTRDDVLTLQSPGYGSTVGPQFEAGGTITGVDESLHLQVRQDGNAEVLGDYCCLPAGGEHSPWSARVDLTTAPRPGVLTLVVWTGGHVGEVERFAVTGVQAG